MKALISCVLILLLVSCQKETDPPKIEFSSPVAYELFDPGSTINCQVRSSSDKDQIYMSAKVVGPQGNIWAEEEIIDPAESQIIYLAFRHQPNMPLGQYSFQVQSANTVKESAASRVFEIGYPPIEGLDFGTVVYNFSNGTTEATVFNEDLEVVRSYNIDPSMLSSRTRYTSIGDLTFAYDDYQQTIKTFESVSGTNMVKRVDVNSSSEPLFLRNQRMFLTRHNYTPQMLIFYENGSTFNSFFTRNDQPLALYQNGDWIFTNELEGSTSKLNVYNLQTGAFVNTMNVPNNMQIKGFYSLDDPNIIYFVTGDPSTAWKTEVYYYNLSLNAISNLGSPIVAPPLELNPIEVVKNSGTEAWIFTQIGIFKHKPGNTFQQITLGLTGSESIIEAEYSARKKQAILQNSAGHHLVDVDNEQELLYYPNSSSVKDVVFINP